MCDIKNGDKVRIIKEGTHKYEVGEIVYLIQDFGGFLLQAATGYQPNSKVDGSCFVYRTEVEKVATNEDETPVKSKQPTKADLKTGMRLVFNGNRTGIVMKDVALGTVGYHADIIKYIEGRDGFDHLGDNLNTCSAFGGVEKILRPKHAHEVLSPTAEVIIVWEREAPKSKEQVAYEEAVEASEKAREAYVLAQKKLEALNPSKS